MEPILSVKKLSFSYGNSKILTDVSIDIESSKITAIYGESGSGKSTLLSVLSLMYRETIGAYATGEVLFEMRNILDIKKGFADHRRKVTYIYQEPNPLNKSIFENIAFPMKIAGIKNRDIIEERVHSVLNEVHLWHQVKDELKKNAHLLSGGQKQKLCIARALVMNPKILLLDEPTSSLDSRSKTVIEELISELGANHSILFVSHDHDQIDRVADCSYECRGKKIVCSSL